MKFVKRRGPLRLRWRGGRLVGLALADHGVQDVDSAACQAGQRGRVGLAFGSFAVVVDPAWWVLEAGERGHVEGAFEGPVTAVGLVLALDSASRLSGCRSEAGVRGDVGRAGEGGAAPTVRSSSIAVRAPTPGIEVRISANG